MNRELGLGAQVTVLSRDPAKFRAKCPHLANDPAVTLLAGDVRDFEFPSGEFQYVIHAATEASAEAVAGAAAGDAVDDSGGDGADARICGEVRGAEVSADKFGRGVWAAAGGDDACAGELPGAPDPLDAASVYAEGKRASELMCALHQKTAAAKGVVFEAKIARCWAFCGPHLPLDSHFAIGNFIGDVLSGRPISIGGDGTPEGRICMRADLTVWLWTMLFRAPALVPVNVGSGQDVSIRELAEVVAATLAPGTEIRIAKQAAPGAASARYVPSVARADELLGLRERVGLEEMIRRTAAWYRA